MPFDVCGAMSQGYIGYHIQQALRQSLAKRNLDIPVVTLLTQVVVDAADPAFQKPTKPIGAFYTQEEAEELAATKGYTMKEDAGRGWRRVVASPIPKKIVEIGEVKKLSSDTIQLVMEAVLFVGIGALIAGTMMHLFTLSDGIMAWIEGASSLVSTMVVLVLAWTLAGTIDQLGTVYYVVDIISAGVPQFFVPTLVFATCCVVSFAAGSYGCMYMIMPIAVPLVAAIGGIAENPAADPFMLSCVAAVLSGAIFGDHSSPHDRLYHSGCIGCRL